MVDYSIRALDFKNNVVDEKYGVKKNLTMLAVEYNSMLNKWLDGGHKIIIVLKNLSKGDLNT